MRNSIFALFAVLFAAFLAVSPASAQITDINYSSDLIVASTAWITDTVTVAVQKNNLYRGGHFVLNITDTAGTASVVVTIQGYDETSGAYYTLLTGAAKTAPGTTDMIIYPGCIAASNTVANMPLPKFYRAILYVPSGDSVKASFGEALIK